MARVRAFWISLPISKTIAHRTAQQAERLKTLNEEKVGIIGVRASSLNSWTARSGKGKDVMCTPDPNWPDNAGTYGIINTTDNKYVQIGKGENYQFCAPDKSAFETMFKPDYYTPKLRLKAQENLEAAFEKTNASCSYVPGATPETVAANEGNKNFFHVNKDGTIKDPFHPNARDGRLFSFGNRQNLHCDI